MDNLGWFISLFAFFSQAGWLILATHLALRERVEHERVYLLRVAILAFCAMMLMMIIPIVFKFWGYV